MRTERENEVCSEMKGRAGLKGREWSGSVYIFYIGRRTVAMREWSGSGSS